MFARRRGRGRCVREKLKFSASQWVKRGKLKEQFTLKFKRKTYGWISFGETTDVCLLSHVIYQVTDDALQTLKQELGVQVPSTSIIFETRQNKSTIKTIHTYDQRLYIYILG